MYLKRLELQGFKTFAQKTVLAFEPESDQRQGITAIVGPNGSGKSNVADAVRWVMGEQSMRLLRGKKSEDVIFSGSEKKSRSGFAEVQMTLVNDDHPDVSFSEIVLTRRLYRDGQSEYEINKQSARLSDVTLLLAQCGVGQRTYSVIGQGMVDEVLSASPSDRKLFFDEAAGLRPFQLKRRSSIQKLQATQDHLRQAELLMREISPRLQSLERQVKRLEQREGLEEMLRTAQAEYYGGVWRDLRALLKTVHTAQDTAEKEAEQIRERVRNLEKELSGMEKDEPVSDRLSGLRTELQGMMEKRAGLREKQIRLEASREVARVRAEKPWTPLPLSKIISGLEEISSDQETLSSLLQAETPDLSRVRSLVSKLMTQAKSLVSKLQRPAPEDVQEISEDPRLSQESEALAKQLVEAEDRIASIQRDMQQWEQTEAKSRSHLFELQHALTKERRAVQIVEQRLHETAITSARAETRRDAFLEELRATDPDQEERLEELANTASAVSQPELLQGRIAKLRAQLEWIGGIDPETIKEHAETKKRYAELSEQTEDLIQALASLQIIIRELDQTIADRSRTSFRDLNREFGVYFKKLFGGGHAELQEVYPDPSIPEGTDQAEGESVETDSVGPCGIEIIATPPNKRLKSIALLSGGERALISIALICAIMATNPSPFVVLDEVDAALDEANSKKLAEIIHTLGERTQFVLITHNRATMGRAHVLYGVTLGEDGISKLLSVKFSEAEKVMEK